MIEHLFVHVKEAASRADDTVAAVAASEMTVRCEAACERTIDEVVEVRTRALRAAERTTNLWRAGTFIAGFALAALLGIGWTLLAIGAVVHYAVFRPREWLAGGPDGLSLVRISRRGDDVLDTWPTRQRVDIVLRTSEPDIELRIDKWSALATGVDLQQAELTIRAGRSEPLRIVDHG